MKGKTMKQSELLKKIADLEKRIAGLEARPPAIINIPYTVPYYIQIPQFNPWVPYNTEITCGTANTKPSTVTSRLP